MSSLMYRAFFALGDEMRSQEGVPVGAVHGYLGMATRLVAARRPDEIVHVYDHEWRPVARTDIYPGYKANRPPDPEGLPRQFELLRGLLDATGTLQAQTEGWEAEDAIGAFCVEARETDRIEIVSGDRDLIPLVRDPVVRLLFTVRGVSDLLEFDEAGVLERYGVPASRYLDFAILRGDPSDGLPGVRGVGEKTARALVQTYGSLDEILADAATQHPRPGPLAGKPAVRAKLLDAADYLAAMRRLVPINIDAPLSVWAGERDDSALLSAADALGVRGAAQRFVAALDSAGAD
ncbi:MAG: 5'-3' exonuclease [Actinomycetota bacterium]